jgi:hypothetical protein
MSPTRHRALLTLTAHFQRTTDPQSTHSESAIVDRVSLESEKSTDGHTKTRDTHTRKAIIHARTPRDTHTFVYEFSQQSVHPISPSASLPRLCAWQVLTAFG